MTYDGDPTQWSDSKKFRAETWRKVILAIIGALAAIWILKPSERRAEFAGEVLSTKLKIRADAVEQFSTASYAYTVAAYKACRSRPDSDAMSVFENEANEQVRLARNRLARSFDNVDLTSQLTDAENLSDKLHRMCKNQPADPNWEQVRHELKQKDVDLAGNAWKALDLSKRPLGWWASLCE
jgi:hypothetical protein